MQCQRRGGLETVKWNDMRRRGQGSPQLTVHGPHPATASTMHRTNEGKPWEICFLSFSVPFETLSDWIRVLPLHGHDQPLWLTWSGRFCLYWLCLLIGKAQCLHVDCLLLSWLGHQFPSSMRVTRECGLAWCHWSLLTISVHTRFSLMFAA